MTPTQGELDAMNADFWNEICGTGLAKEIGITDHSPESLRRFDDKFLSLYPYFLPIVRPERMAGKDVLEIGLGYGTLGQQLVQAGARYVGLDLAPNAVRMTNHRMQMLGKTGTARLGSALEMPFADQSFDYVCSIGCFHHTGNVQRCFDETWRVLRPGGTAVLMVYNKYSFRQWNGWPLKTFTELMRDCGLLSGQDRLDEERKFLYDHNREGHAAPEVVLFGKGQLRKMLGKFENVRLQKQNADHLEAFRKRVLPRRWLLWNLGRMLGLDIYIEANKPATAPLAEGGGVSQAA